MSSLKAEQDEHLEFKFAVPPSQIGERTLAFLDGLEAIEHFRRVTRSERTIKDRYLDTPDAFFERNRRVVRIRHVEGKHARLEIKQEWRGEDGAPRYHTRRIELDDSSLGTGAALPEELRSLLSFCTGAEDLRPVLSIQTNRTILDFHAGDGMESIIRVHLDRSRFQLPEGQKIEDYEVEVHAPLDHEPAALMIGSFIRTTLGLIPIKQSKSARARSFVRTGFATPQAPKKVILDTDMGVDDAVALLLALRSGGLEVLAVTAVGGNVPVEQVGRNIRLVLHTLTRLDPAIDPTSLPVVALGQEAGGGRRDASDVHGVDGIGGVSGMPPYWDWLKNAEAIPIERDAGKRVADLITANPGEITLVTTGPLSNVAAWIETHGSAMSKLKGIVAMGGVFFDCGNRSPAAEFNIHADPGAARRVLEFCREPAMDRYTWRERLPLTLVGLDVTHRVILQREQLAAATLTGSDTPNLASFVRDLTGTYMDFYRRNEGLDGCFLHDPLAIGYVIDPSFCRADQFHVEIEDKGEFTAGATVADARPTRLFKDRGKEVTWVCYQVDSARFERYVGQVLTLNGG